MEGINVGQSVAILVDGNNIGKGIVAQFGEKHLMNFDAVIPKILRGRSLNRLIYLREGKMISKKFAQRLKERFFGIVIPCHKSVDVTLAIRAIELADKVDTIVIMSGDSDFIELVKCLKARGVRTEIVSVRAAASSILLEEADSHFFVSKGDVYDISKVEAEHALNDGTTADYGMEEEGGEVNFNK